MVCVLNVRNASKVMSKNILVHLLTVLLPHMRVRHEVKLLWKHSINYQKNSLQSSWGLNSLPCPNLVKGLSQTIPQFQCRKAPKIVNLHSHVSSP